MAVIEAAPELAADTDEWRALAGALSRLAPDLLVLNELPFGRWLASSSTFDADAWRDSIALHERCVAQLGELGVPAIVGSRPAERDGVRCNEGFVWRSGRGADAIHTKQHLPHGAGYWETHWTDPGPAPWQVFEAAGLKLGMMICTDIMFPEHARTYGREGVQLIVSPRAMPPGSTSLFDPALKMAAVVSGCYVASSNRGGRDSVGEPYEGRGCVISPLGVVLGQTGRFDPVVAVDIDTAQVAWKQGVYPCDVD